MADGAGSVSARGIVWLRDRPVTAAAAVGAVVLGLYVLVYPLALVRYPPIIDLPFHAAQTSIIAHYGDPSWHFQEQFTLHPVKMPYVTMYGIGALLSVVAPPHLAAKGMVLSMLVLLPAGLAVLCWGMRKSPFIGVSALALTWNTLTHWGFLNFLGALGLMAMALGFALRTLDRPTRGSQIGLAVTLVLVFFTHVYRVPFALLACAGAAVLMAPVTGRVRPLLAPLAPATLLFVTWLVIRDRDLLGGSVELGFDLTRLGDLRRHLFGAYAPPDAAPPTALSSREAALSLQAFGWLVAAAALSGVTSLRGRRSRDATERGERGPGAPDASGPRPAEPAAPSAFARRAPLVPAMVVVGLLVTYLALPLEIAKWFYVYPREAIGVAYFALALIPDLPRAPAHRLTALGFFALAAVPMTQFVATEYRRFEGLTRDFREIAALVPKAPKLFYLVYERRGTLRRVSPFLHLPAWLQAEKGGWLNFHFVQWNHSVVRYREGGVVPPALPDRFEWTPQHFRMAEQGRWFDTFLVRHTIDPSVLFEVDPTVHLVARRDTWWLYRRDGAPGAAPATPPP